MVVAAVVRRSAGVGKGSVGESDGMGGDEVGHDSIVVA